jgi:hypothetical protein
VGRNVALCVFGAFWERRADRSFFSHVLFASENSSLRTMS